MKCVKSHTRYVFIVIFFITAGVITFYFSNGSNRVDITIRCEEGHDPMPDFRSLFPSVFDDDRGLASALPPLNAIPKTLHLQWKTRRLPEFAIENVRKWSELHPGWHIILWTDNDLEELVNLSLGRGSFRQAYDALPKRIMQIDFTRYLILQQFGGVYADIDVTPLRNLEPVLKHHSCVLAREPEPFGPSLGRSSLLVSNVFMASQPGHPFWGFLMAHISERCTGASPLERAGPIAMTDALRRYSTDRAMLPREAAVFIAPSMYFYPRLGPTGDDMHKKMLDWPCSRWFSMHRSAYSQRICYFYQQYNLLDWTVPFRHPRTFNFSFTQHNMFNSWNSDSEKKVRKADTDTNLWLLTPSTFLSSHSRAMNPFDREIKVETLNFC